MFLWLIHELEKDKGPACKGGPCRRWGLALRNEDLELLRCHVFPAPLRHLLLVVVITSDLTQTGDEIVDVCSAVMTSGL